MEGFTTRRIVVPVNGAATDEDAVMLACRLARRDKARVSAVSVMVVRRGLPLGTRLDSDMEEAERVLERAEAVGARLDISVHTELLQAREAGPAIVDQAREWNGDLLVIGVPFRERFGEFHMGRTVPYLLKFASCRVLLIRQPFGNGWEG